MSLRTIVISGLLVAIPLAAFGQMATPMGGPMQGGAVKIRLHPQSGSGEKGTATLTPAGSGSTRVRISLTGAPSGVAQPAHIHKGTCANLDPNPEYPLQSVTNGTSVTVVPVALSTLLASPDAINVHKSAADLKTYVACGNIVKGKHKTP